MANRTAKEAKSIHGRGNPQYLSKKNWFLFSNHFQNCNLTGRFLSLSVEKIVRTRIYDSKYWKEDCFALNMELLVDKAVDLRYVGGTYGGNIKTSPFICLVLKMLQVQPEPEIVDEFISQDHFK